MLARLAWLYRGKFGPRACLVFYAWSRYVFPLNKKRKTMFETARFCRVHLGGSNSHAKDCFQGQFIGVDWNINKDLQGLFQGDRDAFMASFHPIYGSCHPGVKRFSASLVGGMNRALKRAVKMNADFAQSTNQRVAKAGGAGQHAAIARPAGQCVGVFNKA